MEKEAEITSFYLMIHHHKYDQVQHQNEQLLYRVLQVISTVSRLDKAWSHVFAVLSFSV